jgi:hypothetical protein
MTLRNPFKRQKFTTDEELFKHAAEIIGSAFHMACLEEVKTIPEKEAFEMVASMMLRRMTEADWLDVVSFTGTDLKEPFRGRKPDKPGEWTFES